MKAVVLYGAFDLRVEEVPTPTIGDEDVLVKVRRSGICGADLDIYKRWNELPFWKGVTRPTESGGRMIGHEFFGEVVKMGAKAKSSERFAGFKVGDHIVGAGGFNSMAEFMKLSPDTRVALHRVPADISEEQGCLVERLTTAWGAMEGGRRVEGETAVVIGTGGIGLCLVQLLKVLCKCRVIAVDVSDMRLALARQLGADATVNAGVEDSRAKIVELTGSIPVPPLKPAAAVDAVYDCVGYIADMAGVVPAMVQAMDIVRPTPRNVPAGEGSKIVLVGAFEKPIPLDLLPLLLKRTKIVGTHGGAADGIDECFELMRSGRISFKGVVSHVFPLDKAKEAFETAMKPKEALQVQIRP